MSNKKKVFIKTYGCQMNEYDSEKMMLDLEKNHYEQTSEIQEADMVLLNTCNIREKAADKVYSELGRIKRFKDHKTDLKIGVTGCVAQAESLEIFDRQPAVDFIIGPQSYHKLPDIISKLENGERNIIQTSFEASDKFNSISSLTGIIKPSAFVTIQEGCDKFCTFCVVPYTRGSEFSRSAKAIINEAKKLVSSGTKELTLLGQNVNAWHGEGFDGKEWGLGRLIRELADLPELYRIRYTTSHPLDMDDELINAHAEVDKLIPYLHLPIQSGSDKILHAMNRRHTALDYLRIIERLRSVREDVAMSGDFIVGFPGETDRDFADTINLITKVGYASAYSFKYSVRPGTPAADKSEQVLEHVKSERLLALQQLLDAQQYAFNKNCESMEFEVFVEQKVVNGGKLNARTPYMQSVYFEGSESLIGEIVQVKISDGRQNSLFAEIIR